MARLDRAMTTKIFELSQTVSETTERDCCSWGGERRMAFTTRRHAGLDPASSARRGIAVKMDPGCKPGVTAGGGVARGGWRSQLAVMPDLLRHPARGARSPSPLTPGRALGDGLGWSIGM